VQRHVLKVRDDVASMLLQMNVLQHPAGTTAAR
jgi:hypothetical protein